jgi:hypothetical protein
MDPKFFRKYADIIGEAGPVPAPAATTPPKPGAPATTPPAAKPVTPPPAAAKPGTPTAPAGGNVPPKQPTTAPGATPPASIGGMSQSTNATGDVTKSFNAGDVSVSSTQTPGGYVKQQDTSYQMGDTNVAQSKTAPNYAGGAVAAPTTTTVTTGSGEQGTAVKGVGFGGASGGNVGNNVVTSGNQELAGMAKTMTQNQPVQEDDEEAEFQRLKEFLAKPY